MLSYSWKKRSTLAQTSMQNFAANKLKERNEKRKRTLQSLQHDFVKFWLAVIV